MQPLVTVVADASVDLSTPRLLTDASAKEISRHDYLPYGEEVTLPGTDVMKFTGHERDLEAGQDYMHARYYARRRPALPATVIRAPGRGSKARGQALRPIYRRFLPRLTLQLEPSAPDELILNTGRLIEGAMPPDRLPRAESNTLSVRKPRMSGPMALASVIEVGEISCPARRFWF